MDNLKIAIYNFENNLQKVNNQLDKMMWKIETFEEYMSEPNEVTVEKLIENIAKLKKEYTNLQAELVRIKNLQKEAFAFVEEKLHDIRQQQKYLRDKILQ